MVSLAVVLTLTAAALMATRLLWRLAVAAARASEPTMFVALGFYAPAMVWLLLAAAVRDLFT